MEKLPDKGPGLPRLCLYQQTIGEQFKYGSVVQVIAFVDRFASRAD
jgi:hypothetical protein